MASYMLLPMIPKRRRTGPTFLIMIIHPFAVEYIGIDILTTTKRLYIRRHSGSSTGSLQKERQRLAEGQAAEREAGGGWPAGGHSASLQEKQEGRSNVHR